MGFRFDVRAHGRGWSWRLLGANNRTIARSPQPHPDPASARRDAARIAALAAGGRIEIVGDGRGWRWVLLDDDAVRAVSAGVFARRSDCQRAVPRFRSSAVLADVESPEP